MRVNLDYYKGEDLYSDGDIEQEIIDYMEKYKESDYEKVFGTDMRWPVFYHLTPIRQNILNWYKFKPDCDILEIGAGMGAITGVLCKNSRSVTSVELSKRRATAISKRHSDKDNLEIIVGNLNDIKFDKKFDYITLVGVYEYAALFTHTENPYVDFLKYIRQFLKDDGKLLIAIENKFGLKYFAGAAEDHTEIKYDSIVGYFDKNGAQTFGKTQLNKLINDAGFNYINYYYPMPDYKLPNVIFSDTSLPNEVAIEKYYHNYYHENSNLNFDEKTAYKEIIKNDKFDFFANSYFIEISSNPIENNIDFALFNSLAKLEDMEMITRDKSGRLYQEKLDLLSKLEPSEISEINYEYTGDLNKDTSSFFNKEIKFLDDEILKLNNEIVNLKERNVILQNQIDKIVNSKSWKLIQFFRKYR